MYNIYGSKDSTDTDIAVSVPEYFNFADIDNMQKVRKILVDSDILSTHYQPNINLIKIKDGVIKECFIGIADELNNAIYETYNLHEQKFPMLVNKKVRRDPYLKLIKTNRTILTFFSRLDILRPKIKKALKHTSSNVDRMKAVEELLL
jgi:hypothetical protein